MYARPRLADFHAQRSSAHKQALKHICEFINMEHPTPDSKRRKTIGATVRM
jgi:hypothetical protein